MWIPLPWDDAEYVVLFWNVLVFAFFICDVVPVLFVVVVSKIIICNLTCTSGEALVGSG